MATSSFDTLLFDANTVAGSHSAGQRYARKPTSSLTVDGCERSGSSWRKLNIDIEMNHNLDNLLMRIHRGAMPILSSGNNIQNSERHSSIAYHHVIQKPKIDTKKGSKHHGAHAVPDPIDFSNSKFGDEDKTNLVFGNLDQLQTIQEEQHLQSIIEKRAIETEFTDSILLEAVETRQACSVLLETIVQAPKQLLSRIALLAIKHLDILTKSRRGSSIVQKIIQRSDMFCDWLSNQSEVRIINLSGKEFSSRMLQVLLAKRADFCYRVLEIIMKHYETLISNISSVFFICTAIRQARKAGLNTSWIFDTLLRDCSKVLTSKYRKRILLTFLEHPTQMEQTLVFKNLLQNQFIERTLRDKFLALILGTLVNLGNTSAEEFAVNALNTRSISIYKAPFFKTFMAILDIKDGALLRWIHQELLQFETADKINDERTKSSLASMYQVCANANGVIASSELIRLKNILQRVTGFEFCSQVQNSNTSREARNLSLKKEIESELI